MRILLGTKLVTTNKNTVALYNSIPYIFVCSECNLVHRGAFPIEDRNIFSSMEKRTVCAKCMDVDRKRKSRLASSAVCPCKYCKYRASKIN
jgi:hypothetical protein